MIVNAEDTTTVRESEPLALNGSSQGAPVPLEQLILDSTQNKYQLILQTIRWAKELRGREGIPTSLVKLLDRALEDLLTGRVTPETVKQIAAVQAAVTSPEVALTAGTAPAKPAPTKAAKKAKKKTAPKKKKK
ncbi:MAG: DNA-directed RNA polymerase subunit omega [Elusimicrobia bacterium]|nr:DNA-directed RNA polymerase subunit omega [Elusimicrobiota bacterium]